ncbi:hypothetical protein EI42_05539 [Thermosporothrix hazakensis]|jgi:hypothetical protein|uniref:Uncharacterized protein n=1 Tax=Thermosporothrix hazakensis TaxID=644383 RepID=A0A326TYD0_THEHA|nr:hypothetical protein [Thermosporothrix hazakensis]PZW22405.1 hypothetical protein EI42_05539 [Thermosporothrix hazakensis]GCE49159.1 hypothetical protein KTH_40280 [Thermosporothrix hazakensis]
MTQRLLHVRFNGRSEELSLAALHLGNQATDQEIKRAVTHYLDLPTHILDDYVIVRTDQAVIVRPEALYG